MTRVGFFPEHGRALPGVQPAGTKIASQGDLVMQEVLLSLSMEKQP
jgi:hypothetical protein